MHSKWYIGRLFSLTHGPYVAHNLLVYRCKHVHFLDSATISGLIFISLYFLFFFFSEWFLGLWPNFSSCPLRSFMDLFI